MPEWYVPLIKTMSQKDYEIIIVDDPSKDGSTKIIEQYKKFENFLYFNKKNIGVSTSANKAIKKLEENIVRLDADDYVSNNFLSIMSLYIWTQIRICFV